MRKNILKIILLVLTLVCVITPAISHAQSGIDVALGLVNAPFAFIFKYSGMMIMRFFSLWLGFFGLIFDYIVKISILNMADSVSGSTGIGATISSTWGTIRDVANVFFIFVLLYTAFKAMFSLNYGNLSRSIVNIILVALLINFSLFFTKVVIDLSNVVAIGFYNAISSAGTTNLPGQTTQITGITAGYMNLMGIHSIFNVDLLNNFDGQDLSIITMALTSSVFMIIVTVIFAVTSLMFIARFITLIFLMVISPLALVAIIVPGLRNRFDQWLSSLLNQSFFAPVFMGMTWISLNILGGLKETITAITGNPVTGTLANISKDFSGAGGILLNFTLVIGFAVGALIISKSMASKSAGFGQMSGVIGAGAFGGAAWLGRTTAGRIGKLGSETGWIQGLANNKNKTFGGFASRTIGRPLLYASEKAKDSTFDLRKATMPTSVVGDAIKATIGKTRYGKALGLDDINIPSIEIGSKLAGTEFGKPGDKGYAELKAESKKRVEEREAKERDAYDEVLTQKIIDAGKDAGSSSKEYKEMEERLAKLSDKETEALVASNKDLLKSQNFANMISVRQLEAIIKSDKLSESEKQNLKNTRFAEINTAIEAAKTTGVIPPNAEKLIKSLLDSEIEMINPDYIEDKNFIGKLKSSQIDNILKNTKFSKSKKDALKEIRKAPLVNALHTGIKTYAPPTSFNFVKNMINKELGIKEVAGLMGEKINFTNHTGAVTGASILTHPDVIEAYTPKILKRMAEELDGPDIQTIRAAIEDKINHTIIITGSPLDKLDKWLKGPNGSDFS